MFAAVIAVQAIWSSRYHPVGHAAEHLSSATVTFGIAFFIAVTVWALAGSERRRPELWLLVAVIVGAAAAVTAGNVQVVDVIGADDWSTEQAEALGSMRPGFAAGHDLAKVAAYGAEIGVAALAAWLAHRRAVPVGVAVGAVVLTVIVPAWTFPGAGIVVLAIGVCVRRAPSPDLRPPSV